jgi:hypothetical protein
MQSVVADPVLRERLFNLTEEVEVRDEDGRVLGKFVPRPRLSPEYEELMKTCPFSDEELERRSREPGGRTLAEIWKSLCRTP